MKTTEQDVPILRFKDEQGKDYPEWEEKLLGDISKFSKGKGISKCDVISNGAVKCIRYGQLYTHYGETISNVISSTDIPTSNLVLSKKNDVIIPASGETAPDIASAACVSVDGVALGGDINIIRCQQNGIFLAYYLNNKKTDIARLAQGISVIHLYAAQLKSLKLSVPSKGEQQKIAAFLSSVDKKIEQLNRKKALLEQYKKGMMQKLFNQEIRFKDEQGKDYPDWEEKRLSEILTIRYGKDHKSLHNGHVPVLGTGGVIRYVDSVIYNQPSVLIGRKGTIDKPQYIEQPFWTVDTLFYTEIIPPNIPFFIFLVVSNINFKRYNEATGVPSLNANTVIKIRVYVPSKEEQQKIAAFMSAIDRKIELVSEQLKQAQIFKKGLLQQMFI